MRQRSVEFGRYHYPEPTLWAGLHPFVFYFSNQSGKPVREEESGNTPKTVPENVRLNPAIAGPLKEAYDRIRHAHETSKQ